MLLKNFKIGVVASLAVCLLACGLFLLPRQTIAQSSGSSVPPDPSNRKQEDRDREMDGKARILYAHSPLTYDIRVGSIRIGEKKETLLFKDWGPYEYVAFGHRISPDGKRLAFRVMKRIDDDRENVNVYIHSLDETGKPVDMNVEGRNICWSPDGRQLAVSGGPSGNVIVDVATKKQSPVQLPKDHTIIDWSPDGSWFLVRCEAVIDKVFLVRMTKGDNVISRIEGTDGAWWGRISPDGKRVLLVCNVGEGDYPVSHLWIADLDGRKPRQITKETNGRVGGYSWSPSGKRIAYDWVRFDPDSPTDPRQQETESFLMVIDSDGANPSVLTSDTKGAVHSIHLKIWDWR